MRRLNRRTHSAPHPASRLAAFSVQAHRQALNVYRDLGDRNGAANALLRLGGVLTRTGDYPEAAQVLGEALGTLREFGSRMSEGNALHYLGVLRRHTGDYPAAAQALDESLAIFRAIGDRGGEVEGLNERAAVHRLSGELVLATEAHALAGLGRCALKEGRAAQGETCCGRHCRSCSGSASPRPPRSRPNWTRCPVRHPHRKSP